MALRFFDSFDHYPNTEMLNKWTSWSNTVTFATGRFGSCATTASRNFTKTIDAQSEWIIGFAFKQIGNGNSGPFLRLMNGGTVQDYLYFNQGTLKIQAYQGNGTLHGTGTKSLLVNVWYYVEWRVLLSDTVGVSNVRVDGVDDINFSGDTINSGTTADRYQFGDAGASNNSHQFDDLYICDGTGSAPHNTFLGDCRVEAIFPNGNGATNNFTRGGADSGANWSQVEETDSNDDTDYVESAILNDKELYAYPDLASTSGTVYGVQILPWARKTDAGSRSVVTVARTSGGTEADSSGITLPQTYTYIAQDIRTTKPGGGAWTIADVNGAQFGIKISA